MEYRKFENLGKEASLLGFGCMRFPTNADGSIDEVTAEKMLDDAYANGVTYFDTAYPYHEGRSEDFVGRAMKKHPRGSFFLATKLPVWLINTRDDAIRIFDEQLARLRTDYIDFYLLHSLSKDPWKKCKDLGLPELFDEYKAKGKIKYLGFSFHDKYAVFEEIVKYRDWDFAQIQYNYMDTEDGPGKRGYDLAKSMNIPLVIMEPVHGGCLAGFSEEINAQIVGDDEEKGSISSYALRWVGTHDNAKVILSGMSTPGQLADNLNTFDSFKPLSEAQMERMAKVAATLKGRIANACTGCRYCMPCPFGVDIPMSFSTWNMYYIYHKFAAAEWNWKFGIQESAKPKNCKECGACESHCPQHIQIRKDLKLVQAQLDAPEWK